ncbi:WSSV542 [White spot syndrome virus]|uniref:WSSV542 n=1 Tax=White spot syndrome virus TaxID=342409 RepID=A0A2I6SCK3_9VIRU|nr:WSSV542 [White spot syndrome virus]
MSANKTLFEDYMIIGGKSMDIEAGLDKPRDLDSKLVILSDRPSTMQLMKENC